MRDAPSFYIDAEKYAPVMLSGVNISSYSPLFISCMTEGREWSLDFRQKPEPAVIFKGVEPTEAEMVRCCAGLNLSAVMVEVLMVIVRHELKRCAG